MIEDGKYVLIFRRRDKGPYNDSRKPVFGCWYRSRNNVERDLDAATRKAKFFESEVRENLPSDLIYDVMRVS